jgi:hypothetical protein
MKFSTQKKRKGQEHCKFIKEWGWTPVLSSRTQTWVGAVTPTGLSPFLGRFKLERAVFYLMLLLFLNASHFREDIVSKIGSILNFVWSRTNEQD